MGIAIARLKNVHTAKKGHRYKATPTAGTEIIMLRERGEEIK